MRSNGQHQPPPTSAGGQFFQVQGGGDANAAAQGNGHRATVGVKPMRALGGGALVRGQPQVVVDVHGPDHQYRAFLAYVSGRVAGQVALTGGYIARFQRAPQRAGQSPAGGRHHVVERRGVRLMNVRIDAVVLGHLGVDAEQHRVGLGR